jgi:hypothetical protein
MRATLEYNLPEDQDEHKYALAGLDALLTIDAILAEIRSALHHDCGELSHLDRERQKTTCYDTLEKVRDFIITQKEYYQLPELT